MRPAIQQTDGLRLDEVLQALEGKGFFGVFRAGRDGEVACLGCSLESPASGVEVLTQHRIEGVSDPSDEMRVVGLRCPGCQTLGTLTLPYGPRTTRDEARVLLALRPLRRAVQ